MWYTFVSPLGKEQTKIVIRDAVQIIGGKIHSDCGDTIEAQWYSRKYSTARPYQFTFYVGNGVVQVESPPKGMSNFLFIKMKLTGFLHIWNYFVYAINVRYPNLDFGIRHGDLELVAVEIIGDGQETIYQSTTYQWPSLSGAIIGAELFGTAGAIIGASLGPSYTVTTESTKYKDYVWVRVRYSNGMLAENRISKKSKFYKHVMANMEQLSTGKIPADR